MAPRQKVRVGRPLVGFPNTDPVVAITMWEGSMFVDVPSESGEFVATAIDAEQGDIASSLVWTTKTVVAGEGEQTVDVGGEGGGVSTGLVADTAGFQVVDLGGAPAGGASTSLAADTAGEASATVAGAPAGTVVPLSVATATYDVDVTFEDGGLQQLAVVVTNSNDYAAIAAILDGAVTNGTIAFVAGSFVCTDDLASVTSTALVAAGTAASGGGDLFAAITAQAAGTPAVTFPAPIAGTTTVYTAQVTVDAGLQFLSLSGNAAQTFTDLLTELALDTSNATWTLAGAGLTCTSDSTGVASTIAIVDTDLFAALTGFSSIVGAVAGTTTIYTATIAVNGGGGQAISVTGESAQTYTDLITELNLDTTGAEWDLTTGSATDGPRARSTTFGASSSILITVGTLFPALTNFDVLLAAIPGTDAVFGVVGVGGSPILTFPLTGAQTITATATDAFGATGSDAKAVTVSSP